ncbi:unnamed protein product [Arctogadus glacialis]
MDLLDHGLFGARSPYNYTFNFWNDYLGLSTIVAKNKLHPPSLSANSITESLKATLGLDDSPLCACERLSLLRPYGHLLSPGDAAPQAEEREATYRGSFGAMDLHMGLALDRRRNKQQPHVHSGSGGRSGKPEPKVCVFCRNNGAPEEVYGSHILKTADGRVLCPILRAYTCPLCSANGDHAHTIKYCPLSRDHPSQRAAKGARTVHHKRLAIF